MGTWAPISRPSDRAAVDPDGATRRGEIDSGGHDFGGEDLELHLADVQAV